MYALIIERTDALTCCTEGFYLSKGKRKMSYGPIDHMDSWHLAQAQTMIDLFREAHGRTPDTKVELCQFLEEQCAAGRIPDGPILPSPTALLKIMKYGRLV
jgi:hypothetical protein